MKPLRALLLSGCVALAAVSGEAEHPAADASAPAPAGDVVAESYDPSTRSEVLEQIARSGLYLLDVESIVRHVHAHLTVAVNGVPVAVPQVGVDLDTLTAAPVHTHGADGILHIEADAAHMDVALRLDDFLAVLGAGRAESDVCRFYTGDPTCRITVTVDGRPTDLKLVLDDNQRIVLTLESQSSIV